MGLVIVDFLCRSTTMQKETLGQREQMEWSKSIQRNTYPIGRKAARFLRGQNFGSG